MFEAVCGVERSVNQSKGLVRSYAFEPSHLLSFSTSTPFHPPATASSLTHHLAPRLMPKHQYLPPEPLRRYEHVWRLKLPGAELKVTLRNSLKVMKPDASSSMELIITNSSSSEHDCPISFITCPATTPVHRLSPRQPSSRAQTPNPKALVLGFELCFMSHGRGARG